MATSDFTLSSIIKNISHDLLSHCQRTHTSWWDSSLFIIISPHVLGVLGQRPGRSFKVVNWIRLIKLLLRWCVFVVELRIKGWQFVTSDAPDGALCWKLEGGRTGLQAVHSHRSRLLTTRCGAHSQFVQRECSSPAFKLLIFNVLPLTGVTMDGTVKSCEMTLIMWHRHQRESHLWARQFFRTTRDVCVGGRVVVMATM